MNDGFCQILFSYIFSNTEFLKGEKGRDTTTQFSLIPSEQIPIWFMYGTAGSHPIMRPMDPRIGRPEAY